MNSLHEAAVSPEQSSSRDGWTPMYRFLKTCGTPLLRMYFRLRAEGVENLPTGGAFILAANHSSYLDPLAVGAACPRPVHFIMLQEFWEKPFIGTISRMAGSFPIDHSRPATGALRQALSILKGRKILGIFPEGGRSADGSIGSGKAGAALLAVKTGLPLVPTAIIGADRALPKGSSFPRPVQIIVRFGRALSSADEDGESNSRDVKEEITSRLMEEISLLSGGG